MSITCENLDHNSSQVVLYKNTPKVWKASVSNRLLQDEQHLLLPGPGHRRDLQRGFTAKGQHPHEALWPAAAGG